MVKTVNILEYLEMCEKSPNWNHGSPAPLTLSEALDVYRDLAELREQLAQAHELTATQAKIIEHLQDELAARDHRDAMKDERPL